MTKKLLSVALAMLAFCGLLAAGATSANNDAFEESAELRDAVSAQGVMKHLRKFQKIADENGDTRASGTPGYDESADYVAKKMEKAGYEVVRQPFEFEVVHRGDRGDVRADRTRTTASTSVRRGLHHDRTSRARAT